MSNTGSQKKSGGPWKGLDKEQPGNTANYKSVPPEDRKARQPHQETTELGKTIVVHDERGQVVSITKVAPDAKFGVGVKPRPGQVVKEYAAGTLAQDPFVQSQSKSHVAPETGSVETKQDL